MVFRKIVQELLPEIDVSVPEDFELDLAKRFIRHSVISTLVTHRRSIIGVTYGDPGTGKSYFNLTLGWVTSEILGQKFSVKKSVKWDVMELIAAIKDAPKRHILLGEEAGVMIPSREWYTKANRLFSYVAQTFRFRQILLLLSVPNLSFIDSHVRALVQFLFETFPRRVQQNLIRHYSVAGVKPREIFQDPKTGHIYYYSPMFRAPDGSTVKMTYLLYTLPPEYILEEYEEEKRKYFERLLEKGIRELEEENGQEADPYEVVDQLYKDAVKRVDKFAGARGAIDLNKLMAYYRIPPRIARLLKARLELE